MDHQYISIQMVQMAYTAFDYGLKHGFFGKMGNILSAEDREMLVMLENCGAFSEKLKTIDNYIFGKAFNQPK